MGVATASRAEVATLPPFAPESSGQGSRWLALLGSATLVLGCGTVLDPRGIDAESLPGECTPLRGGLLAKGECDKVILGPPLMDARP